MKPNQVDRRAVDYREALLSDDPYLLEKNYHLDFSLLGIGLFRAPVRHIQYLAASGPGFLVFRERNLPPDGYVEDFNNLAIYLETDEGIVSTSLTVVEYRGRYARLDRIRWLGTKTMEGALKAQAIIRQYVLDPDAGPERALERGRRDFEEVQRRPYCSEPEGGAIRGDYRGVIRAPSRPGARVSTTADRRARQR
jgi:hypothetical protein